MPFARMPAPGSRTHGAIAQPARIWRRSSHGGRARAGLAVAALLLVAPAGCGHDAGTPAPAAAPPVSGTPVPDKPEVAEVNPAPARVGRVRRAPAAVRLPKPPAPAPPAPAGAGSGDAGLDRFVAAVQAQLPLVALDRRDEEVEELGTSACEALAAGRKAATVAGEMRDEGVAPEDADRLVKLARSALCPG